MATPKFSMRDPLVNSLILNLILWTLDKQQNDLTNLYFVFHYFGKQSEKLKSDIFKLFN